MFGKVIIKFHREIEKSRNSRNHSPGLLRRFLAGAFASGAFLRAVAFKRAIVTDIYYSIVIDEV